MKVKIRDARFAAPFPVKLPGLPQVAFAGRSNVGKSSLINTLLNRKSLVKTSKIPGKTQMINFFRVDMVDYPSIYLVDLPGYGYAKAPKEVSRSWNDLISRYLTKNKDLRLVMLLVDIRRDLKDEEFMLMELIAGTRAQVLLVATKTDKLGFEQQRKRTSEIIRQTGRGPVITSANTGLGMDILWENILSSIQDPGVRSQNK
jgi:GTP-binding protein